MTPTTETPDRALGQLQASVGLPIPAPPRPPAWTALLAWPRRRWAVAAIGAVATVVVMGLPTAMIPNPVFGRSVPTTWWAWPALLVTAILGGLLAATYVRVDGQTEQVSRSGMLGGVLTYLAVGCPVCNKIALLALGYSGALRWFAPAQPWLAAAGFGLLGYALFRRLQGELACPVPVRN